MKTVSVRPDGSVIDGQTGEPAAPPAGRAADVGDAGQQPADAGGGSDGGSNGPEAGRRAYPYRKHDDVIGPDSGPGAAPAR